MIHIIETEFECEITADDTKSIVADFDKTQSKWEPWTLAKYVNDFNTNIHNCKEQNLDYDLIILPCYQMGIAAF